jgi:MFS family permease
VLLLIPALLALRAIAPTEIDPEYAHGSKPRRRNKPPIRISEVIRNRPLLIFAGCLLLFHLANAAMLPLMGSVVTMRSSQWATVLIAACIVAPQLVVAALSPWIGSHADSLGRRRLLLIGFAALPIRGLLFVFVKDPLLIVVVQLLDGVTASVLAVLVPLVVADVTRGSGHFNLGQGVVGTATGIGASLSLTFAGLMTDRFGSGLAFAALAATALLGLAVLWLLMPETKPEEDES